MFTLRVVPTETIQAIYENYEDDFYNNYEPNFILNYRYGGQKKNKYILLFIQVQSNGV